MDRRDMLKELKPVMNPRTLIEIQDNVRRCTRPLLCSITCRICLMHRGNVTTPVCQPRAWPGPDARVPGMGVDATDATWFLPEDIQAVGIPVMAHRLGHDIEQPGQSGRTAC